MANVTSLLTSLCTKINDFSNPNQASSSSTLPSNTIPNPRNEARAITTRSGVSYEGPSIPMPPPFVNPDVVEETSTEHVPPPLTQKVQETNSQTTTKVNQEGIVNNPKTYELKLPYPERRNVEKRQEKDKEKLEELANTPLSENCSAVILKKLPEKLGDSCRFTIPCDFSKLKCQGLADLGSLYHLMPLGSFIGKFTYPADFVVVDYVPDEQIPLILGRPFLRTARALIDVYDEKLILRDGNESLTLNMQSEKSKLNGIQKSHIPSDESFPSSSSDKGSDLLPRISPMYSLFRTHLTTCNVNLLFEENYKDVEIKFLLSSTYYSPEASVLEDYLEKIRFRGINLTPHIPPL
ncbi:reverse transcriptase domain-containing protein [Tanacetum coccineum]